MRPVLGLCQPRGDGLRCRVAAADCTTSTRVELRICINRTCKRQGSEGVLKLVADLGLPGVRAAPTGCLGNCGNGPNMVLLPNEQMLNHVATPSDLMQVLRTFCGSAVDEAVLQATQLRLAGNAHAAQLEFQQALDCFTRGLELNPANGAHMLYSNRSVTYLQMGDKEAALADARRAVEAAPKGYHVATIRLIDSLYAVQQYAEAAAVCRKAAEEDSSFKFRQEYPAIKRALQSAGQAV